MKIAIIGAGAMGGTIGSYFSLGGADVRFVDPYQEHIDKINADGLQMDVNGEKKIIHVQGYYESASIQEKMDLVVIVTKGSYIASAIQDALCLFDKDTCCMAIQNGLGNVEILSQYIEPDRIFASIVQLGASMPAPGEIQVLKREGAMLSCGPVTQEQPPEKIFQITEILTRGGLDAFPLSRKEINQKIWYKVTANCTGNACCAITRLPLGRFTNCPEGIEIKTGLLEEILSIAEHEGITGLREITTATNYWPENNPMYHHIPSTAQDVRKKKKTEIDFLNGAIVRLGKKHGIPTPYNTMVTNLIHIIENNYNFMF
ncbi:MAG: 2-dehydropantoate 2-reductase [Clostridiales bacterium]|nr:2-dehydropantoate 2-reductase [Clostridiales bacterium]